MSICYNKTQSKTDWFNWNYTSWVWFQIRLPDTTPETYMEDLVGHIDRVLEVMNLNIPGVKKAPWHKTTVTQNALISELSDDPMDATWYLWV